MASLADAYKPSRRDGMEHSPRPLNPWPAVDRAAASLAQYIPSPTQGRRMSMDEAGNVYGSTAEENQLSSLVDFLAGTGAAPTAMARQTPGLLNAIGVWHGSPHKFERFDLSKMGTGEGAQAYGWGAYLAESPEVAGIYAKKAPNTAEYRDLATTARNAKNYKSWDDYIRDIRETPFIDDASRAKEIQAAESLKSAGVPMGEYAPEGNLYKVSLEWPDPAREAADPLGPHHFLDWDDEFSNQSEGVKQALMKLGFGKSGQTSGRQTYQRMVDKILEDEDIAEGLAESRVSKAMLDAGIPGIRYLDAGSRGAGDGTRNYVVFQDSLAKILERNGIPVGK